MSTAGSGADRAPVSPAAADAAIASARGALGRYRVMAIVTGVFLLVLCVEMIMRYVIKVDDDVLRWVRWVPYAHGWVYMVYLVTVGQLWTKMRWDWGRLATMVLAGVVPVMSFIVERRVHADADATLNDLTDRFAARA